MPPHSIPESIRPLKCFRHAGPPVARSPPLIHPDATGELDGIERDADHDTYWELAFLR
jgi:hypothetical protein